MLWFTHKELSLQILNKIARINRLTNSIQIIILRKETYEPCSGQHPYSGCFDGRES